ncbi:hypothetical protein [Tepidibacillus sp. LV47]|uniref:hypothetical protein n=1 Tax=Tepidibacillus sp. LV47 TaxID=3398228 RepID=UPI003AAEBDA5
MIEANQILKIGPIQLPLQWIILFIGLFLGTFVSEQMARKKGWEKENFSDLVFTLILIVLLVYKFGWIVFDLKRVIQNPQVVIWASGTNTSFWIGILIAILYLVFQVRKKGFSWVDILQFSWFIYTITFFFYSLLIKDDGKAIQSQHLYHPVNLYKAFWLGLLLILFFRWRKEFTFTKLMLLYMGLGYGLLIISIFDVNIKLILGLTQEQWLSLLLSLIGMIGMFKKEGTKRLTP